MIKPFFSPGSFFQDNAIAVIRIIIGLFMVYHGLEVFDGAKMEGYSKRFITDLKMERSLLMSYLGKTIELVAGCLLVVGLFTRLASLMLAGVMVFITFVIGQGKFYMEDQHPFLFILFAVLFFFSGGGKWSLDNLFFKIKNQQ